MILSNPKLLKTSNYVDGKWINSDKKYKVYNPANGDVIAECDDAGKDETRQAIDAANMALKDWSALPAKVRSGILRKWNDLILKNADDLAMILTMEQGKPLAEAKGEIRYGASFIEWFAEEAKRNYGDVIPTFAKNKRITNLVISGYRFCTAGNRLL